MCRRYSPTCSPPCWHASPACNTTSQVNPHSHTPTIYTHASKLTEMAHGLQYTMNLNCENQLQYMYHEYILYLTVHYA